MFSFINFIKELSCALQFHNLGVKGILSVLGSRQRLLYYYCYFSLEPQQRVRAECIVTRTGSQKK